MEQEPRFFTYEELKLLAEKSIGHRGEEYIYPSSGSIVTKDYDWTEWFTPEEIELYGKALTYGGIECMYTLNGKPACIVGDMLYTANEEGRITEGINGEGASEMFRQTGLSTDDAGTKFLTVLQNRQDGGLTWGRAYHEAVKEADKIAYP